MLQMQSISSNLSLYLMNRLLKENKSLVIHIDIDKEAGTITIRE